MPVLFAAEVDHIQTVLFRASRQRQVTGGSRLLYLLGEQAKRTAEALPYNGRPLKWGGGSFLVIFEKMEEANTFGETLAGVCRTLLDASLTIPKPIEYEDNDSAFQQANETIQARLRREKRERHTQVVSRHAPTTAFCQSSGVGLATKHIKMSQDQNSQPQYVSSFARAMEDAGKSLRQVDPAESAAGIKPFLTGITTALDEKDSQLDWPNEADALAAFDEARGNVAYLVADGNDMGHWFGRCAPEQVPEFAEALETSISTAIAETTSKMIACFQADELYLDHQTYLPVLPLILAGDDVFLLLPAPYALDFARCFCRAFESHMNAAPVVEQLKKKSKESNPGMELPPVTMSAAVVFCKGGYPYYLAHRRGEDLLQDAKRMAKYTAAQAAEADKSSEFQATIAFDLISGGVLVGNQPTLEEKKEFRPTLAPYWVSPQEKIGMRFAEVGKSIDELLTARYKMRAMPHKRLVELENLYMQEKLPRTLEVLKDSSNSKELNRLRSRLAARLPHPGSEGGAGEVAKPAINPLLKELDDNLVLLGDNGIAKVPLSNSWFYVTRAEGAFFGHGMPDLLNVWEYAQELTYPLSVYKPEE